MSRKYQIKRALLCTRQRVLEFSRKESRKKKILFVAKSDFIFETRIEMVGSPNSQGTIVEGLSLLLKRINIVDNLSLHLN